MTPKLYAEKLRVQRDLLAGVHPLVVTGLFVYPSARPEERRPVEVAREAPLLGGTREAPSVIFWWPFS